MTLQIGSDSIVIEQRIVYIEEKDDVLQELDHSDLAKLAAPISGAKGLSATLTRMPFRNPTYRPLLVNPSMKLPSFNLVTILGAMRSEEHTSELQSRLHLVCRLLLEKKKK